MAFIGYGSLMMLFGYLLFQEIHHAIEDEASIQSRQPKKMKTYSESHKSEKNISLVVGGKVTAAVVSKGESAEVKAEDDRQPVRESPRNNKLRNLVTRGRGTRSEAKKTSVKK